MDELTPPILKQDRIRLLEPLRPVVDDAPLVVRAERLAASLAPYENSPRLDARFRLAIGQLSLALRGLEGMRANDFALDIVDQVTPLLGSVLDEADAAVSRAMPALEVARPVRSRVSASPRRSRPARAGGSPNAGRRP